MIKLLCWFKMAVGFFDKTLLKKTFHIAMTFGSIVGTVAVFIHDVIDENTKLVIIIYISSVFMAYIFLLIWANFNKKITLKIGPSTFEIRQGDIFKEDCLKVINFNECFDTKVDNRVIAINNLKYAWQFILENEGIEFDYKALCQIYKLTCDKLVLEKNLGRIRTTPVNIGGTKWKPQFPIESQIKEELEWLLNQPLKTKTEITIEIMLWIMRRQMFIDGNKRVAMLFANKIMIDNGCGIITISQDNQENFFEKLIKFYETGDEKDLKQWIYDTSIDGIELDKE